jgi:hypothetical protein
MLLAFVVVRWRYLDLEVTKSIKTVLTIKKERGRLVMIVKRNGQYNISHDFTVCPFSENHVSHRPHKSTVKRPSHHEIPTPPSAYSAAFLLISIHSTLNETI